MTTIFNSFVLLLWWYSSTQYDKNNHPPNPLRPVNETSSLVRSAIHHQRLIIISTIHPRLSDLCSMSISKDEEGEEIQCDTTKEMRKAQVGSRASPICTLTSPLNWLYTDSRVGCYTVSVLFVCYYKNKKKKGV